MKWTMICGWKELRADRCSPWIFKRQLWRCYSPELIQKPLKKEALAADTKKVSEETLTEKDIPIFENMDTLSVQVAFIMGLIWLPMWLCMFWVN